MDRAVEVETVERDVYSLRQNIIALERAAIESPELVRAVLEDMGCFKRIYALRTLLEGGAS